MMHVVTRRSRLCTAGNTVERVLSRPVLSSTVCYTSSLPCDCSPLNATRRKARPCRHLMTGSLLGNATIRSQRRTGCKRPALRKLSSCTRTEEKLLITPGSAASGMGSSDLRVNRDGVHISAVEEANRLIRRHLAKTKGMREDALQKQVDAKSPREVIDAYVSTKVGVQVVLKAALDHFPDATNLADDGKDEEAEEAEAEEDGERADGAAKAGSELPVAYRTQRRAERFLRSQSTDSEVSSLLVGLHRRALWRVYKNHPRRLFTFEEPGKEAWEYYRRLQARGFCIPAFLRSLLVQLLISEGMCDKAEVAFKEMVEEGLMPSEACSTEVIRLRVERGQLDEARKVLEMLENHGSDKDKDKPKPRFRSYQPLIRGLVRRADIEGVMDLWAHMQRHNVLPKESFVVDMMADLASNPEGTSDEQAESLTDTMIEGVSRTIMYPSEPTVTALIEGFGAAWTDVSEKGECMSCGSSLNKVELGPSDRMQLRASIMRVAALQSARQVQRLGWFASWLSTLDEKPTAVIDGPNVAYTDQNHENGGFRLQQVDWLAEHMHSLGERVMIVMPCFYCLPTVRHRRPARSPRRKSALTENDYALLKKWAANDWLIITEGLDDLYWMYCTVAHDDVHTVGLTNDTMRDHRLYMPSERHFLRWRRGHMVQYVFDWGPEGSRPWNLKWDGVESAEDVELRPPTVRLVSGAAFDEVQRSGDTWHLPVRASGSTSKARVRAAATKSSAGAQGEDAKTWLCIPVPKSKKKVKGIRNRAAVDAQQALATDAVVHGEDEERLGEEARATPNVTSGVDNCTTPTADYSNVEWPSEIEDAQPAVAVGVPPLADDVDNDTASDVLVDAEPLSGDDADRTTVADPSVGDEKRRTDESPSGHSILPGGRASVNGARKQTLFF